MEEMWAKQNREQHRRDTAELLDTRDRKNVIESTIEIDTAKYIAAYPDVRTIGSPNWQRVKDEFDFLQKMGDPNDATTELKALRAVFGSPDR